MNEVSPEDIDCIKDLSLEERYQRLCGIRLRLIHCIDARRAVYESYGDGDIGHAAAISYVASQISKTENLLQDLCEKMITAEAATTKMTPTPCVDPLPTHTKIANKKKARRSALKTSVENRCQMLRTESEMLEEIANQSLQRYCDVLLRMMTIVDTDSDISVDMRKMISQTFERNGYETMLILGGIAMLIYQDETPIDPNDHSSRLTSGTRLQAYFYHNDVSDEKLKATIIRFQEKHLVKKHKLIETFHQANTLTLDPIYLQMALRLSLKLFNHLFSVTGPYTTERSIATVIILACGVAKMSSKRHELSDPHDALRRRCLVRTHGDSFVTEVEGATHAMLDMCDTENPWHPILLPWTYFHEAKDLYVQTAHSYAQYILQRANRQLFDITS